MTGVDVVLFGDLNNFEHISQALNCCCAGLSSSILQQSMCGLTIGKLTRSGLLLCSIFCFEFLLFILETYLCFLRLCGECKGFYFEFQSSCEWFSDIQMYH